MWVRVKTECAGRRDHRWFGCPVCEGQVYVYDKASCKRLPCSSDAVGGDITILLCEIILPSLPLQSPSWTANLDDVPNPPGGTLPNGSACVTRMVSITPGFSIDMIPLSWSLLPTDSNTNNIATFPYGAGDGNGMNMSTSLGTYGLPSGGNIGISITG